LDFSSTIPRLLETTMVSLWGFAIVLREETSLEVRATDGLKRRRKRRLNRQVAHRKHTVTAEDEFAILLQDKQKNMIVNNQLRKQSQIESQAPIIINDEMWIDLTKRLSVLDDKRVHDDISASAAGMMSYMLGNPNTAFAHGILSHILYLLEPTHAIKVRAYAAIALSRLCAAGE